MHKYMNQGPAAGNPVVGDKSRNNNAISSKTQSESMMRGNSSGPKQNTRPIAGNQYGTK